MARQSSKPRNAPVRPAKRWRPGLGTYVGLAAVAVIVALVVLSPEAPGYAYGDMGNAHVASADEPHAPYNSAPPSSGPHLGFLAPWGVHVDPVPAELFVHNLEDGGVVFTYDCPGGCPEFAASLTELVSGLGDGALLTAYSGIVDAEGVGHRGAVVAWTRVLYFDDLDEATRAEIDSFVGLYRGVDHHRGGS